MSDTGIQAYFLNSHYRIIAEPINNLYHRHCEESRQERDDVAIWP